MKKQLTIEEIRRKLEWFHGGDFNKYPFIQPDDEFSSIRRRIK